MKNSTPRQLAVIISLITSAIAGITHLILDYPISQNHYLPIAFSVMIIFIIVFIIVNYMLSNFIFEKINPLYKTVQNLNVPESDLKKDLEDRNLIQEVNDEVKDWAIKKTEEIAQLKQLAKYRKEFLGNVSHELKTPIFNIQGYILTLLDGGIDDESINRKYLEKTEKSINRMISIVDDLEAITQLESGELKLNYRNFNIIELIKEVFESQELKAKEKLIELRLASNNEKSILVYADREQIFHLVSNLVANSLNYGNIDGFTEISFLDMNENILIEITDNGIGIPKNEVPRVFERFYRIDKSRSRHSGGTGLGLSIVKHIIEAHKQTINVRSSEDNGTSFAFTLKKGVKNIS